MYKVVVVEDEDLIRNGLICSIPWAELGCTVVGQGRNGIEGIEQIKQHNPDIVIADINMPIMDGLEMLRQTNTDYCYSAIILSSYSKFDYAKTAMEYGSVRYLLKPIKRAEIYEAIEEAKEQCHIRRAWLELKKNKQKLQSFSIQPNPPSGSVTNPVVQAMLDYAEKHYQDKVTLQKVAEELNYSISYLNKNFKKEMKITFIDYLNRLRIQKAMDLIKEGKYPLQDISWLCGIGEYKYFNIVFKKYIGCSPKDYINKIKEWTK